MKTTANKTKKVYVIASSEYEANMPDLFLMDADGNYYGVSNHSYAGCCKPRAEPTAPGRSKTATTTN